MTLIANQYIWHAGCIWKLLWIVLKVKGVEVWVAEKQFSALEREHVRLTTDNWTQCRLHGMAA